MMDLQGQRIRRAEQYQAILRDAETHRQLRDLQKNDQGWRTMIIDFLAMLFG